jgi:hypothetical protein
MGKRKRKMFESPEERAAFFARWEENDRRLEACIKRREALAAKRKPQSQP